LTIAAEVSQLDCAPLIRSTAFKDDHSRPVS
jgi:hypothetical protein